MKLKRLVLFDDNGEQNLRAPLMSRGHPGADIWLASNGPVSRDPHPRRDNRIEAINQHFRGFLSVFHRHLSPGQQSRAFRFAKPRDIPHGLGVDTFATGDQMPETGGLTPVIVVVSHGYLLRR